MQRLGAVVAIFSSAYLLAPTSTEKDVRKRVEHAGLTGSAFRHSPLAFKGIVVPKLIGARTRTDSSAGLPRGVLRALTQQALILGY